MRVFLNLRFNWLWLCTVLLLFSTSPASALLYFENQFIYGYSSALGRPIFYSSSQLDAMQKPSTGFDYIQKFSDDYRDIAVLALQGRFAWNESAEPKIEPQLYNAYLKLKGEDNDLWFGHNRPAVGLAAYFDSHALLLSTLSMTTLGFDRDWGLGYSRDYDWGNIALTATTGSGMSLALNGNHLISGRISRGIIAQDNYTVGASFAYGRILDTMGVHIMDYSPQALRLAALDFNYLVNNLELLTEIIGGEKNNTSISSLFCREGIVLAEEGRLKLEAQQEILPSGNYQLGLGGTFILNPDLTLRALGQYDSATNDHKLIAQIYSYNLISK